MDLSKFPLPEEWYWNIVHKEKNGKYVLEARKVDSIDGTDEAIVLLVKSKGSDIRETYWELLSKIATKEYHRVLDFTDDPDDSELIDAAGVFGP